MLSVSAVASLRRGRSAKSTLEPGLSANFKEHKPKAKAKVRALSVRIEGYFLFEKVAFNCFVFVAFVATISVASIAAAITSSLLFHGSSCHSLPAPPPGLAAAAATSPPS